MKITMKDILLIARWTAEYVYMNDNIGSYSPEMITATEYEIKLIQLNIIARFGKAKGKRIIKEIREYGYVKRTY